MNALYIMPRILINDAAGPEAGCTTVATKLAVASLCPGRKDNADAHPKTQVMGREVVVAITGRRLSGTSSETTTRYP